MPWRRRFLSYNIFLDILSKQVSSFPTPKKLPPPFYTAVATDPATAAAAAARLTQLPPLFGDAAAAAAAAAHLTQLPPLFDNDAAAATTAAAAAARLSQMVYNPNNLGRRTYLSLLSHQ